MITHVKNLKYNRIPHIEPLWDQAEIGTQNKLDNRRSKETPLKIEHQYKYKNTHIKHGD